MTPWTLVAAVVLTMVGGGCRPEEMPASSPADFASARQGLQRNSRHLTVRFWQLRVELEELERELDQLEQRIRGGRLAPRRRRDLLTFARRIRGSLRRIAAETDALGDTVTWRALQDRRQAVDRVRQRLQALRGALEFELR